MKKYLFLFFSLFIFSNAIAQEVETVELKDTVESLTITLADGKKFTIDGVKSNNDLKELGEILSARKDELEVVLEGTEFPPKGVQGWLTLLLSLLASGFLNKIIVSGTRAIKLIKNIFDGTSTNAIVWGSAMAIGFVISFWQVNWNISNIDFANWASMTLFVSVFSMFVHESINKVSKKKEVE